MRWHTVASPEVDAFMPLGPHITLWATALHAAQSSTGSGSGLALAAAGLIVGFTVGLTGMGGGALMTPILVLIFGVTPSTAVSSDLLASLVMKPLGGSVHLRRGTVNWAMVRWLCLGSVPSAFAGVLVLRALGSGKRVEHDITVLLGWALLVASVAMVAKAILQALAARRLSALGETANEQPHRIKPVATVLVGVVGGLIVGMTSVGSGSLMIVLLMLLYPRLAARTMVGTDLVQAIPLVGAATLGHLLFGDVSLSLTTPLLIGCLPGVYVGARVSSRAKDTLVRPALVLVLLASALKLLGLETRTLGYALAVVLLTALPLWGAIDATLRREVDWNRSGRNRTLWVTVQGVGAPFGIGFLAAVVYFTKVRRDVVAASIDGSAGRLGLLAEAGEGLPSGP